MLPQKIRRKNYTDQDIRLKAISIRDELVANLEFIESCIRKDRLRLQNYEERFGDLKYRPIIRPAQDSIEPEYGLPTETVLEPLASTYRSTINSLLQSIKLIQNEIIAQDDVEAPTTIESNANTSRRANLRDSFRTESQKPMPQSEIPTKLVENQDSSPTHSPEPILASIPDLEPKASSQKVTSSQRPWRDTTPKATPLLPATELVQERSDAPKAPNSSLTPSIQAPETDSMPQSKPVGLSPALRQALSRGDGTNRLAGLASKYLK